MNRLQFLLFFVLTLSLAVSPLPAQRNLTDIPNPDPEIERKSFIVADGFEVNLFAADPQIAKPIQMNFDPQGRLWIASSSIYPHIKPGEDADDRILIVEDQDGDGTADKTSVFADGLLIPTAVVPGDGGAYVGASTELLHFADTDDDGKADKQRVVLSGFGTEDTHHIVHTLRWGPGGLLYFNQSIYIHSHIETPFGVKRLNAGGIWEFRPETMQLDVLARGWVNTWGHHIDQFGQSFATDGAGGEGINYAIPGAAYPTAQGVPRIFHGLNPGSPKYCGLEIVTGRHLPEDWQGNLITNDFRGHRVVRYVLSDDGAGFAAREQEEVIRTSHVAFRPIDVKMGPDGAIYIADWYNPIIQHGEVDFRDDRRDHVHGRIWRVTYKGKPALERPKLVGAPIPELLEQLKSPEQWTRENARQVLKEAGPDSVLQPLQEWQVSLDNERDLLEALWMHQALRHPDLELLNRLIQAEAPEVRAAAVRVAKHWRSVIPTDELLETLEATVRDEFPRVRLEAVRALGAIGTVEAVRLAMLALDQPTDRFLDYALWLTAWETQDRWRPQAEAGTETFGDNIKHLTFALMAVNSPSAVPRLLEQLKSESLIGDEWNRTVELVAARGNAQQYAQALTIAVGDSDVAQRHALVRALVRTGMQRNLRPAGDLKEIAALLSEDQSESVRSIAAEAVGVWKIESLAETLSGLAVDSDAPAGLRAAAVNGFAALGKGDVDRLLNELSASSGEPLTVREAAVVGLARRNARAGADAAVVLLATVAVPDSQRLIQQLIQLKTGPGALAVALKGQQIPPDAAKLAVRAIDSSGRKLDALKSAFAAAGSITTGARKLSPEEMAAFVADVRAKGNRVRGEAVYRRAELSCMKCHAIGGAGGKVGPDMASIGGSAQVDYLIESLLDPNAKVKEGYHTIVVLTDEGKTVSGIKVRQTDSQLILRDAQGVETGIALDSIDQQASGSSLMPAGLSDKLTHQEIVDLVRFLSELGKVGGLQVSREKIVRNWQVMLPSKDVTYRLRRTRLASVTEDDPAFVWQPAYGQVDGHLPLPELPRVMYRGPFQKAPSALNFVRFYVEASTPGEVDLVLNSADGVTLWLNNVPLEASRTVRLNVPAGRHRVTMMVSQVERESPLLVRLQDVDGSPAQVQLVTQ